MEGEAVGIPVGADTAYQLTAALVEKYWTPKTAAVLIASPSNPTGTLIDHGELERIHAVVKARGGVLIVDEIYHGLTYGKRDRSALEFADDLFIINSFSKYFGMTGWRLGWMVAPEQYIAPIDKLAQNLFNFPVGPRAAGSPRRVSSGYGRAAGETARRIPRTARLPATRTAQARLRHPGHAGRGLLYLCELRTPDVR